MSKPAFHLFPRSIRWRLQLWFAFLLVCLLTGFGVAVDRLVRLSRFNQIDAELGTRVAALGRDLRESPFVRRSPPTPPAGRAGPGGPGSRRPAVSPGEPGAPVAPGTPGPVRPAASPRPPGSPGAPESAGAPGEPRVPGPPGEPGSPDGPGAKRERIPPPEPRGGMRPPDMPPEGPPPGGDGPRRPDEPGGARGTLALSADTAALFGKVGASYYYSIWYRDGTVLLRSAAAPAGLQQPQLPEQDTFVHWRTRGQLREAFHCSAFGDCVMAGRPVTADLRMLRQFSWIVLTAGGLLLVVGLGVGGWITAREIRPIGRIANAAARISHGNLSERIEVADTGSELGRLAGVLNSTFARLESAFVRQRQFTADAAHELRTPLAVIIAETQSALMRERPAAEYREAVETCLETAQQMRRITDSLLELARLDAGEAGAARGGVDLAEVARGSMERLAPLAAQRGIRLHGDFHPAVTHAVAGRVTQAIVNLLSNAIDYNRPDGEVRISTRAEAAAAVVQVADTGVGIAAEDLPHIFERFYCVDKARSRAGGHSGLGLAICKAMVEAEGGAIEVESTVGSGTTFTVRLPRAEPGEAPGPARS